MPAISISKTFPLLFELLFFSLIAFLPLSTEFQFTESLGMDLPDELLMILLTGVFILVLVNQPRLLKRSFYNHPLFLLLLLHVCWIIITTIFSEQPLLSIKYLLAKAWYVIPFIFMVQIFVTGKKQILMLGMCLLLPMSFVILQSLIRHSSYRFSFAGINETLDPFFRNHVNYGAMIICMIPVLFAMRYLSGKKYRSIIDVLIILFITGVVFSYSRGAWLAVVVAGATWVGIKRKIIHLLFLGSVAIVLSAFIWLADDNRYLEYSPDRQGTVWHRNFADHWEATVQMRDLSTAERFYRWIAAVRMSADYPIIGVGPNNFYDTYKAYTVSAYSTWVSKNEERSTVHNYFLLLLAEQGIAGMVIFILLLYAAFWYAQKLYHRIDDRFYKTCCLVVGCVLAMITTVNFLSDLIETDKVGSLFFLCLGVLISITALSHQTHPVTHSPKD